MTPDISLPGDEIILQMDVTYPSAKASLKATRGNV